MRICTTDGRGTAPWHVVFCKEVKRGRSIRATCVALDPLRPGVFGQRLRLSPEHFSKSWSQLGPVYAMTTTTSLSNGKRLLR